MEINITLLIQLSGFLFLLAWLSKFLLHPLMRLMDEREARIEGSRREAEDILTKAHAHQLEVEARIHDAQKKARAELSALKAEGAEQSRKIIDLARKSARGKIESARAELALEIISVRNSLKEEVSSLSSIVLAKVVGGCNANGGSGSSKSAMELSGVQ